MREFIDHLGMKWDLDDPKTYKHLNDLDTKKLDEKMFAEIGYALCYMKIFHPELGWGKKSRDGGQKKRIMKMIKKFCEDRNFNNTKQWYMEQIFLFECETENMC